MKGCSWFSCWIVWSLHWNLRLFWWIKYLNFVFNDVLFLKLVPFKNLVLKRGVKCVNESSCRLFEFSSKKYYWTWVGITFFHNRQSSSLNIFSMFELELDTCLWALSRDRLARLRLVRLDSKKCNWAFKVWTSRVEH